MFDFKRKPRRKAGLVISQASPSRHIARKTQGIQSHAMAANLPDSRQALITFCLYAWVSPEILFFLPLCFQQQFHRFLPLNFHLPPVFSITA